MFGNQASDADAMAAKREAMHHLLRVYALLIFDSQRS